MRSLDAALTVAQAKTSIKPAVKIVLTKAGEDTVTIEEDRIKDIKGFESPWRMNAKGVVLNNSDGYFTDLDLKGYQAVVSWGAHTSGGKLYSATSPMKVTWQQFDSSPGKLTCQLNLLGIPDLMDLDEANDDYIPASDDTETAKDLLTAIAGATLGVYDHCTAYTIEWDDDENDDALLLYVPADSFRIYIKGSRLAAFRRILEYCNCAARFESDGKIHILLPTTTGEVFDYEYSLSSGHPFLSRAYRSTMVFPNKVIVESQKDDDPQYSGSAQVDGYDALPDDLKKPKHYRTRLTSHGQGDDIAAALIARASLNAEMGTANALMNCGAEVFDYVQVADEIREDTTRTGNHGYLTRHFNPERSIYHFEFGFGAPPLSRHIKELYRDIQSEVGVRFDKLFANDIYLIDEITLDDLPDGETYSRVLSTHITAGQIVLNADISYSAGYDPTDKFDLKGLSPNDLDDIADGASFQRVQNASLTPGGLVLLDQVQVGTYGLVLSADISAGHVLMTAIDGDIDDIANGSSYGKLLLTDLAAGHLKLTSAVSVDGEWYNESGVEIDSAHGINIYGTDSALTTRATKAGTIQCKVDSSGRIVAGAGSVELSATGINIFGAANALTTRATRTGTIQCYVGADGKLYAGAGAVILSSTGIKIVGEVLSVYYGATNRGSLFGSITGLSLQAAGGDLNLLSAGGVAVAANSGAITFQATGYSVFSSTKGLCLPTRTSHPTSPVEGTIYFNTADHNFYGYMNGAWQTLHNY